MPGVAGMCLLPCLVLRQTSFVATGVLSYAANAFARFLLGAILAGALWRHLDVFACPRSSPRRSGVDAAIQAALQAVAIAWVLAACFLAVNKLAGMLTSGIPGMAGGQSIGEPRAHGGHRSGGGRHGWAVRRWSGAWRPPGAHGRGYKPSPGSTAAVSQSEEAARATYAGRAGRARTARTWAGSRP